MTKRRTWRLVAVIAALAAFTAACGDDDDGGDAADDAEVPTVPETIEVTTVDYDYEGLDDEIDAGTTLTLTNASEAEVHELVAFRLPDGEERSVEDLLELSEEEFGAVVGGPPAAVIVAMPGGEGQVAVGSATFDQPGRYVYACFIPVGADPAVYQEALDTGAEEPPEIENPGPPHFTQGMSGEVTVT